uniref:Uncharacterized protein n=1 Tax=viral metagenome TaxID=1070528 RepID=A0A6C0E9F8_9ZZZZ
MEEEKEKELAKAVDCLHESIPNYVFNYCDNHCVVFEKLSDTITDENRENVANRCTALFHANKLKVIKIFDSDTFEHKHQIGDYECNTIIERSDISLLYYTRIETVINLSSRSKITDYYVDRENNKTYSYFFDFYESGTKKSLRYTTDNKINTYYEFYDNSSMNPRLKFQYDQDEKLHGQYVEYYFSLNKLLSYDLYINTSFECNYNHGVKHGKSYEYDKNHKIISHYNHVDGKLHGACYEELGMIRRYMIYDNGNLIDDKIYIPTKKHLLALEFL